MITILAEKPSVARDIARIVRATEPQDGYRQGNGYFVTWAFGHLITLAMPTDYGIEGYNPEDLPILPHPFELKVREVKNGENYQTDPSANKQLRIIKQLFKQSTKIIVATDAGREGELIFRYIYEYLDCQKPFERLWISSLTDKAIQEGLANLQSGTVYDALYQAGKARSESDWLVGINASRALSIAAGHGGYSLGRVQTPTLAMICKRYLENKHFQSVPYWKLNIEFEKDGSLLKAVSHNQFSEIQSAEDLYKTIQSENSVRIQAVQQKTVKTQPPLLYDLTTLQKEANQKFGYSADKTLSIAQSLYEKKVATYPRTSSRYISEDVWEHIPTLIAQFETDETYGQFARNLQNTALPRGSVSNSKVTDHHALLPTENRPTALSEDESRIYQMLVVRLLEAFSEVALKEVTTISLISGNELFIIKGAVPIQQGWKAIQNTKEIADTDMQEQTLPIFQENEILHLQTVALSEHKTKPKPLYNEASLLSAMELAGKEVEDETAQQTMKECGIGTPATRAAIIETLLSRSYVERNKKTLVPTAKGLQVYEFVKDKHIADAGMTGEWEFTLGQIEQSKIQVEAFHRSIEKYTEQITQELLQLDISQPSLQSYKCPQCQQQTVQLYPKIAKCQTEGCAFKVFRSVCKKSLSDKEILTLLTTGKSPLLEGLKSKVGKSFDAYLVLQEDGSTYFEFPERKSGRFSKKNFRKK